MSARFWIVVASTVVALTLAVYSSPLPADLGASGAPVQHSSSLADQTELAVTVYNSDIALVRDVRRLQLPRGTFDLSFQDIAATVNPATVHFRSLSEPGAVSVLEQNYEYDLLDPDRLLRKYVGRDVTLVRLRHDGGVTREEAIAARLLSYNNGPVWQIGSEIVTGLHADHIRFPELPGNLHARPTLVWSLSNDGATDHRVETSYLAGKLSWSADYVLTVARDDRTADLDGWVTVVNGSGTAFNNAGLQLVAGDLNRVRQELRRELVDAALPMAAQSAEPMQQEAFSDYHLYTVGRRTTINHNETKQISMLTGTALPVRKRYVVGGQSHYYRAARPGSQQKDVVQVFYELRNAEASGLGMPMPAGTVRVYQADSRGGIQFVGEDRINHTPKDETLNLKIGNAFDVVAERTQLDFQRIGDRVFEFEYEVVLRNHKASAVTVEVNEPVGGTWTVLRSTHAWVKTEAFALQFTLPVDADGETTLRYRVRATY
jgi:hypothetical protein